MRITSSLSRHGATIYAAGALSLAAIVLTLLIVCAALTPAISFVALHPSGSFRINGEYPSQYVLNIAGLRYGSWSGSDAGTGTLESDAFVLRQVLEVTLAGYPGAPNVSAALIDTDDKTFDLAPARMPAESWTRYTYRLPPSWIGRRVRLRAADEARGARGWLGVADVLTTTQTGWIFRHFAWKLLTFLSLCLTIVFAVAPLMLTSRTRLCVALRSGTTLLLSCFVTLALFRLPVIVSGRLFNPDEAQMTAQALTFLHHPIPWRDFDGTTSGPINTIVLALPGLIGLTPSLASSRAIAVVCLSLFLACQYRFLRTYVHDAAARIVTVLVLGFFCIAADYAYTSYTSETVPMLLIAATLALAASVREAPGVHPWRSAATGALIGSLIFAKLQAAPFALFLAFAVPVAWWFKRPPRAAFARDVAYLAGLAVVPVLVIAVVALGGALNDFWLTYIVFPRQYVAGNCCNYAGPAFFFAEPVFRTFFRWSAGMVIAAIGATAVLRLSREARAPADTTFAVLAGFCTVMGAIAVYAIEVPQTPFYHYLLWLVLPVGCLVGVALGRLFAVWPEAARRSAAVLIVILTIAVATPAFRMIATDKSRSEGLAFRVQPPLDPAVRDFQRLIAPRQKVAMWGWMPEYLVYTQAEMGTRDSISQFQIEPRPFRPYYRARYLADFEAKQPDFVLEAIGPDAFAYHDPVAQGIGSFPALERLLVLQYRLVFHTPSLRLYARSAAGSNQPVPERPAKPQKNDG